jgi:hypothetical protein
MGKYRRRSLGFILFKPGGYLMSDASKSYRVKYEVHCKLQNFFNKEMIVKNCLSKLHAKAKLDSYCRRHYGIEYQCIIITSCSEENDYIKMFDDIFGYDKFGDNQQYKTDLFSDLMKNLKNKKK